MGDYSRSATRVKGFAEAEMDFQLMRQLGAACYGGASVGECFALAGKIENGNPVSWIAEFQALAEKVEADGLKRLEAGHGISARDQLLRANNLYRAAEYYDDPRYETKRKNGLKSRDCFNKAMPHFGHPARAVQIPFEGKFIPAYYMTPKGGGTGKTLVAMSGYDGTAEEVYYHVGRAGVERGYNVLMFDGPGQVGMLRLHPEFTFRPDWEVPVSTVMDWVTANPEIDKDRVAFLGISFGGYFCTRAAAYEPRVKALISNAPIVDLYAYMEAAIGKEEANGDDDVAVADLESIPDTVIPRAIKMTIANLCLRFGQPTYRSALKFLKEFKVDALENIKCPSLALIGAGEGAEPMRQTGIFEKKVSGKVTKKVFTVEEGADAHCQVNNFTYSCAVMYDWLDDLFGK